MNFPIDVNAKVAELERIGVISSNEKGVCKEIRLFLGLLNESYEVGFMDGADSVYYPISVEKEIKKAREDFPETLDENLSRRILELQNEAYFAGCKKRKEKTA